MALACAGWLLPSTSAGRDLLPLLLRPWWQRPHRVRRFFTTGASENARYRTMGRRGWERQWPWRRRRRRPSHALPAQTGCTPLITTSLATRYIGAGLALRVMHSSWHDRRGSVSATSTALTQRRARRPHARVGVDSSRLKRPGVTLLLLWEQYRGRHPDGLGILGSARSWGVGGPPDVSVPINFGPTQHAQRGRAFDWRSCPRRHGCIGRRSLTPGRPARLDPPAAL